MPEIRWRTRKLPVLDRDYVALVSYLPLTRWRGFLRFANSARLVFRQVKRAEGLVGYTWRARIFARQFWTLSVWEDEGSLQAFVRTSPHVDAMARVRPLMGATKFVRWRVRGNEVPVSWDDALRRAADERVEGPLVSRGAP